MTKLKAQIEEFLALDAKRTQGKAEVFRMDSDCGYFNFMLEIPGAKEHITAHFHENDNSNSKNNSAFAALAINQSADFARKLLVCITALEKIENVNSAIDYPTRNVSYGDWELRRIAREALEEIGS